MTFPITQSTQITNTDYDEHLPQLNDRGDVVWQGGHDIGQQQIFLFDGVTTIQLTDGFSYSWAPQLDNLGNMVWVGESPDNEIMFYNGTSVVNLPNNGYRNEEPKIVNGNIVWTGYLDGSGDIFFANGRIL